MLRFAAFLAGEQPASESNEAAKQEIGEDSPSEIPKPQLIERPQNERVVDALKRLSAAYPMLEKKKLLDKASGLVAQNIMFGKPAKDVIDQIEKLFAEAYEEFVREQQRLG